VVWVHIGHFFTPHTLFVIAITIRKGRVWKEMDIMIARMQVTSVFCTGVRSFLYWLQL